MVVVVTQRINLGYDLSRTRDEPVQCLALTFTEPRSHRLKLTLNLRPGVGSRHAVYTESVEGRVGVAKRRGQLEHAKWIALWGHIDGKPVSITVLCHAENFRAPQAARLHPSKPT